MYNELSSRVFDALETYIVKNDISKKFMLIENFIEKKDTSIISESTIFSDTFEIIITCDLPTCLFESKFMQSVKPAIDELIKYESVYTLDNYNYKSDVVTVKKTKIG